MRMKLHEVAMLGCMVFGTLLHGETPGRTLAAVYHDTLNATLPLDEPPETRFWGNDSISWWVTARVIPSSRDDSEVQLTLWALQSGELHGVVTVPAKGSIFRQVESAYEHGSEADPIVTTSVDVSHALALKTVISKLRLVRADVMPSAGIVLDPDVYDFVSRTRFCSTKIHVAAAPGSKASSESIVFWIEHAARTLIRVANVTTTGSASQSGTEH